ncbi:hypothetical protein, partial [Telluribacter sp. SYSU D00476]|uniref:hypothetical protein n=1 Tax=Telluribacter sp. SYSU D00476 TaxID=2811430 RepID=UPI001FF2BA22
NREVKPRTADDTGSSPGKVGSRHTLSSYKEPQHSLRLLCCLYIPPLHFVNSNRGLFPKGEALFLYYSYFAGLAKVLPLLF